MIEVKLTEQELDYIKLRLEQDLDDIDEVSNDELFIEMIKDLYSKLVCLNFNKLVGIKKDKLETYGVLIDGIEKVYENVEEREMKNYISDFWKELIEDMVKDFEHNINNIQL